MSQRSTFQHKLQAKKSIGRCAFAFKSARLVASWTGALIFAEETRPGGGGGLRPPCQSASRAPPEYLTGCHFKVTVPLLNLLQILSQVGVTAVRDFRVMWQLHYLFRVTGQPSLKPGRPVLMLEECALSESE
jgi:hypothetical protein